MKHHNVLPAMVDELGGLKAEISDLTKREREIKLALIESGQTEIDGAAYRATVNTTERHGLDIKRVEALLEKLVADGAISHQRLASLRTKGEVTTVRVVARKQ